MIYQNASGPAVSEGVPQDTVQTHLSVPAHRLPLRWPAHGHGTGSWAVGL